MTDARALLAELEGLREQRAALAGRIAPLGRYSSLRNDLCRKQAAITRRLLEIEVLLLPRQELPPASPPANEDEPGEAATSTIPRQGDLYGGEQPYWVRN